VTGQEHAAEAERLLDVARVEGPGPYTEHLLARAQVHATLSVAAATRTTMLHAAKRSAS